MYIKQIGKLTLAPPPAIKVSVPSHENACQWVCMFGVSASSYDI